MAESNGNESRLDRLEEALEVQHVNIESLHASTSELHASMIELRESMGELRESMGELRESMGELRENVSALRETVGALSGSVGALSGTVGALSDAAREHAREQALRDARLDGHMVAMMQSIARLSHIAGFHGAELDDHEQRLDDLEGRT